MDELKAYLKALPDEEQREGFARRCGTSLGHLRNVIYGKNCSAELAALVDIKSGGTVTRRHLRPDDWHRIWPELVTADHPAPEPHPAEAEAPAVQGIA